METRNVRPDTPENLFSNDERAQIMISIQSQDYRASVFYICAVDHVRLRHKPRHSLARDVMTFTI